MAPLYTKALITGGTSGIGEALAAKLVSTGTKVIVAGRRRDRLDAFVERHGAGGMASSVFFDATKLDEIPAFADAVIAAHPDLDCVVVNAGIQRSFDWLRPETIDFAQLDAELATNYSSAVRLSAAFLPHLRTKQPQQQEQEQEQTRADGVAAAAVAGAHLVYVSATLGLVPSLLQAANYNASKGALHLWIMAVRQAYKKAGVTGLRFVEVFPPAVQTELHDEKHQPNIRDGGQIGMPLAAYIDAMYRGLERGDDQFAVGHGEALLAPDGWETQRMKMFEEQEKTVSAALSKYMKG